jgi:hypothetical protein
MIIHEDKIGQPIFTHSTVDVDEPTGAWECHQNEFRGVVVDMTKLHITVKDQEGDCYDVDPEHVTVVELPDGIPYDEEEEERIKRIPR